MSPIIRLMLILNFALAPASATAQLLSSDSLQVGSEPSAGTPPLFSCPGSFPTDLTVLNCSYTTRERFQAFVNGSLTDQSWLGAVLFGAYAQLTSSPGEWKGTWESYGKRVGVRYNQAVAKGAAEFIVGAALGEDPRHVSFQNDPQEPRGAKPNTWRRIGHAFFDSVSDRRSNARGLGHRIPAFSRFVAAYASGYGGYAWYPGPENTFKNASLRAAQSFGTDVGSSFYTEFSPEIGKALGAIVRRGRKPKS